VGGHDLVFWKDEGGEEEGNNRTLGTLRPVARRCHPLNSAVLTDRQRGISIRQGGGKRENIRAGTPEKRETPSDGGARYD